VNSVLGCALGVWLPPFAQGFILRRKKQNDKTK